MSSDCDWCEENITQDFGHLLLDCNTTLFQLERTFLQNKIYLIYRDYYQTHPKLWEYRESLLQEIGPGLKTNKWLYLYPPMNTSDLRMNIINSVLDFYQYVKY